MPKFALTPGEYETVGSVIQSQQVVFQVFLLSVMPVRLVDTLMAEARGERTHDAPGNPYPDEKNTAAHTSPDSVGLSVEQLRTEIVRTVFLARTANNCTVPWMPAVYDFVRTLNASAAAPPGLLFCIIAVLLFCRFARSSVGDAGSVMRVWYFYTQLVS